MLPAIYVASLLSIASGVAADASSYEQNALCACDQLMRSYDSSTGIWENDWWESANMMSALADFSALDSSYASIYYSTYATTYNNAPSVFGYTNFQDEYYDDEGWWALAWLNVYDLTQDSDYLNLAISLFNDIKGGLTTPCGGGIWWDKDKSYIASISNALYIQLGAGLANRVSSDQKQTYLDAAEAGWDWFFNIGVVNSDHYVVDGVDYTTCEPEGDIYTYNQGVILGAAAELYTATGNGTYLDLAGNIATAVTTPSTTLTNGNSILMDSCDRTTSCSGDGSEFKGPFVKNLRKLQLARNNPQWLSFLETNAQSIWNNDLDVSNGDCLVGEYWAGPYTTGDAVSQGIALDALTAAFAVTS